VGRHLETFPHVRYGRPRNWRARPDGGWNSLAGTDSAQEIAETARLARRAAELGPNDAVALSRGAHALAFVVGDVDAAVTLVDRALVLNPNLAGTWYASGWVRVFRGEPEVAIEHLARAMRLSPLDPEMFRMQAGTAFAHLLAGRFDDAASCAGKALSDLPTYRRWGSSGLGPAGDSRLNLPIHSTSGVSRANFSARVAKS
jgi:tetratricopeptide (TPR) repeat protein